MLSTEDVNAVRAQWEEWTADAGFSLQIDVREEQQTAILVDCADRLDARIQSSLYCQVQVRRGEVLVVDERVAHDGPMLRAMVQMLARTIASSIVDEQPS